MLVRQHMQFYRFDSKRKPYFVKPALTLITSVPFVDGEVVVTGDGCDCGDGDRRVGVSGDVNDWRVGQELHDHTYIVLDGREHHRSLQCTYNLHQITIYTYILTYWCRYLNKMAKISKGFH